MEKRIKAAQQILKLKGLYNGAIDGIAGPKTMAAIARVDGINVNFPKTRQITSLIQIASNERNIDAGSVDGLWGPRTSAAFDELTFQLKHGKPQPTWRPEELVVPNPHQWPVQNTNDFLEFYGERGSQLKTVDLPYELRLSWDLRTRVRRTSCHPKVADSLCRILQRVKELYGEQEIRALRLDQFGGCYNNRKMRNGTSWSTHAWGIALDFDPSRNQLYWGRDRASFSHPHYEDWWKCWEDEGWISLGRKRNFDWMHVQAARQME